MIKLIRRDSSICLASIYLPHIGYGNTDKMKEPQRKQLTGQNETRISSGDLDGINFINDDSKLVSFKKNQFRL